MKKDETGMLHLQSGNSYFYQATSEQTKHIRQFGVEEGILDVSELYQPAGRTTLPNSTSSKHHQKTQKKNILQDDSDLEDQRSQHSDMELLEPEEPTEIKTVRLKRKTSRNQCIQTQDSILNKNNNKNRNDIKPKQRNNQKHPKKQRPIA